MAEDKRKASLEMSSSNERQKVEKLSIWTKLVYSFPRGTTVGMYLLVQTTGRLYYIDDLNMSPADMAMAVAICKCLDLVVSFLIGYWTDHTESRWGRRKPFMAIAFPLWLVVHMLWAVPPSSLASNDNSLNLPDGDYYDDVDGDCTALKAELDMAIFDNDIPKYDADVDYDHDYSGTGLVLWFGFFYFLYYSFGWSATIIPYDALGMELTDDHDERSSLFGFKGTLQNSGYLLHGVLTVAFAAAFSESLRDQMLYPSIIWVGLVSISFFLLLTTIHERPPSADQKRQLTRSLIPIVRNMFSNRPYLIYLFMKIPLSAAGIMPVTLLVYYVKFVQQEENATFETGITTMIVVVSAVFSVPLIVMSAHKWGKQRTLFWICVMQGIVYILATFAPAIRLTTYILGVFIGAGIAGTNVLPDAMLADIIDYDELHTGDRSEGAYTVVETNLQQFVEIPATTIPFLVLYTLGYQNNGGCECGCGVECSKSYLRWHCPGDIGYACGENGDLLYGVEDRPAPCATQAMTVQVAIRFFVLFFPGLMLLISAVPVYFAPITSELHKQIVEEKEKRHAGLPAHDPITGARIHNEPRSAIADLAAHFSASELATVRSSSSGLTRVIAHITLRLAVSVGTIVALIIAMSVVRDETLVTLAAIFMSMLVALSVWDFRRLMTARSPAAKELLNADLPDHATPAAREQHRAVSAKRMPCCCNNWRMYCGLLSALFGVLLIVMGVMVTDVVDDTIEQGVEDMIVIDPDVWGDVAWEKWHEYHKDYVFYVYNCTNAKEVQELGAKPNLVEIRVNFTYEEHEYNTTIEGDALTYYSWWRYVPRDRAAAELADQYVVSVNPVYIGGVATMANSEKELFAGLSSLVMTTAADLFYGDFLSLYRALMVPVYLQTQTQVVLSQGALPDLQAVVLQWGTLNTYPTTMAAALNVSSLSGFEVSKDSGQVLGAGQAGYLWDQTKTFSLFNPSGYMAWLSAMSTNCSDTCAAARAGIAADLEAARQGDDKAPSGQLAMNMVFLWIDELTLESNDGYRETIAMYLGSTQMVDGSDLQALQTWQDFGDLQFGASALTLTFPPPMNVTSVKDLGIDPRLVVAPEIYAYSNGAIKLTVDQAGTFLKRFSDSKDSLTFIGMVAKGMVPEVLAMYADTGVTQTNLPMYFDYLTRYMPEDLFLRGFVVGEMQPDGTGALNGGLFTRRKISEVLFGYHDVIFDYLPNPPYHGIFGPDIKTQDEHWSTNPPPFVIKTGTSDINTIREYNYWRGLQSFHNRTDLGSPCPAPTVSDDCRVWLNREQIAGVKDGFNWKPFQEDEEPEPVLKMWAAEVLRAANMSYDSDFEFRGIKMRKYKMMDKSLWNVTTNPDNENYRMTGPDYLADMTTAVGGTPTWASFPGLWKADSERAKFTGLPELSEEEQAERYQTFLGIEPLSGVTMLGAKRLQYNFKVAADMFNSNTFKTVTSKEDVYYWPYLWVNDYAEVSQASADAFVANIYDTRDIADALEITFIVLGALLLACAVTLPALEVMHRRRGPDTTFLETSRQSLTMNANLTDFSDTSA